MDFSATVKVKRHEKCIFETSFNEIKCVMSVKESNFNEKKIKIFTFAYGQKGNCPIVLIKEL